MPLTRAYVDNLSQRQKNVFLPRMRDGHTRSPKLKNDALVLMYHNVIIKRTKGLNFHEI